MDLFDHYTFNFDIFALLTAFVCITSMLWYSRTAMQDKITSTLKDHTVPLEEDKSSKSNVPLLDPHHIPGHIKRTQQRIIEEDIKSRMTQEDMESEARIQKQQLEAIKQLLEKDANLFGEGSSEEMNEQLRLYGL